MENEEKVFSTRDLYLATSLLSYGFSLTGVDFQIEGQRNLPVGYFKFEDTPELRKTEKEYWDRKLSVEPMSFITNMRGLKAQVSNIYKGPRVDFGKMKKVD